MKLVRQRGVALLALFATLNLVGCSYWQAQTAGPRDVLTSQEVDRVRLTRSNGQTIIARVAEVRGDSIYGTRGEAGPLTCEGASPLCSLQIPISDVGYVELRRFSAIKTAALFIVPVGAFVVVFLAGDSCGSGPSSGPC